MQIPEIHVAIDIGSSIHLAAIAGPDCTILEEFDLNPLFSRITWLAENPLIGKKRDDITSGYYYFPKGMNLVLLSHYRNWNSY